MSGEVHSVWGRKVEPDIGVARKHNVTRKYWLSTNFQYHLHP